MDSKQDYLDKIEELEIKLKTSNDKINLLNSENDKYNNEYSDKVRVKEVLLEKLNEEMKHAKSTVRS